MTTSWKNALQEKLAKHNLLCDVKYETTPKPGQPAHLPIFSSELKVFVAGSPQHSTPLLVIKSKYGGLFRKAVDAEQSAAMNAVHVLENNTLLSEIEQGFSKIYRENNYPSDNNSGGGGGGEKTQKQKPPKPYELYTTDAQNMLEFGVDLKSPDPATLQPQFSFINPVVNMVVSQADAAGDVQKIISVPLSIEELASLRQGLLRFQSVCPHQDPLHDFRGEPGTNCPSCADVDQHPSTSRCKWSDCPMCGARDCSKESPYHYIKPKCPGCGEQQK